MTYRRHFQVVISTLVLVLFFAYATEGAFARFANVEKYVASVEPVLQISQDASSTLDTMVGENAVTWDPTNGVEIERVLTHLRRPGSEPSLLMVGSSQLVTVRDDRKAYTKRVDYVLPRMLSRPISVYNLAMGGMTAPEKAIVAEKASGLIDFDYLLVSITLWDSLADSVRPSVAGLPNREIRLADPEEKSSHHSMWTPAALNERMATRVKGVLSSSIPFFHRRSAIQHWVRTELAKGLWSDEGEGEEQPGPAALADAEAKPVQYKYTADRQATVLRNVTRLLDKVSELTDRHGYQVVLLLTPVRQDSNMPAYVPTSFDQQFRGFVKSQGDQRGFTVLDASELLDTSHYGLYEVGKQAGRFDVLHFDSRGHKRLAEFLIEELDWK